ncbi:MAG: phosphoribosylformylglycinamidine cyclo-ligase [Candidatus Diapherotrites archaeon]|nr:phosphoribosylformylglycinamidine cyclo-ligase [Candidatus Diapherotrites archaeon]
MKPKSYAEAGVDIKQDDKAIMSIARWCEKTFEFRKGKKGEVVSHIGHFANLIKVGNQQLVLSTDGVGSKILVAERLGKYDTLGFDLMGMLVNDVICVGAEPLAVVDYIAMKKPDERIMSEIGKGLYEAAKEADVAVIGGETATLPEMITGIGENPFDLAGTALGIVGVGEEITGRRISEGDVLIGLESSGIHSNGLTLARKVLDDWSELIEPTRIYVKPIMELIKQCDVKGLANITGGGMLNLLRLGCGFEITNLAEPQKVFLDIQEAGHISDEEMYKTFNMGVGFCVVVPKTSVDTALDVLKRYVHAWEMGKAIVEKKVVLKQKGISLM